MNGFMPVNGSLKCEYFSMKGTAEEDCSSAARALRGDTRSQRPQDAARSISKMQEPPMKTLALVSRKTKSAIQSICKDMVQLMDWTKESKLDSKARIYEIKELMEMNDCTGAFYCENSRNGPCVWVAHEEGPSIKMRVVSMRQMRFFPGNVFKECGAHLLFTPNFNSGPFLQFKEVVQKLYSTEKPKDRVVCFYKHNDLVWMRCYRLETMEEVGPRLTLRIEKILDGCFCGKGMQEASNGEEQT